MSDFTELAEWLDSHDKRVRAEALREAAAAVDRPPHRGREWHAAAAQWLLARADAEDAR